MKLLKLKLLAAAVSLSVAGSAFASIADGTSANGEIFLNVYDATAQVSYVKDLGLFMNDFLAGSAAAGPGASLTYNLASDANWTSFLGLVNAGNLAYNVIALDTVGNRYLSTSNDAQATIQTTVNSSLKGFSSTNSYINAVNGLGSNPGAVSVNGSAFEASSGPADQAYYGGFAPSWQGKAKFNSVSGINTALNFWQLGLNGAANLNKINATQYAGQWDLTSNGSLTYVAAVPEPGTWAMMLAGILTVGAIARRRLSV